MYANSSRRSLRIALYSVRSVAFNSCSGGTEARSTWAYMRLDTGDRRSKTASATALIRCRGWSLVVGDRAWGFLRSGMPGSQPKEFFSSLIGDVIL